MKALSVVMLLMASLAFVLLGCSDNSAPIVSSGSGSEISAPSLMKYPGPGAWVNRFGSPSGSVTFFDAEAELLLVVGINDFSSFCAVGGGRDWYLIRVVLLPDADPALRRVLRDIRGDDLTAVVWHTSSWPSDFCEFVLTNDPLAEGNANLRVTDNDLYSWTHDKPNANAWGRVANGTLIGTDGQEYMLNAVIQMMNNGAGRTNEVIRVQLTPKGRN